MSRALKDVDDEDEYQDWNPEEWSAEEWADDVVPHLTEAIDDGKLDDHLQDIARACRLRYYTIERKGARKGKKNTGGITDNTGRFENAAKLDSEFVIGRDGLVPIAIKNFPPTSKALVGSVRAFGHLYLKENLLDHYIVLLSDLKGKNWSHKLPAGTTCKIVHVGPDRFEASPILAAPGGGVLTADQMAMRWRFYFDYNKNFFEQA